MKEIFNGRFWIYFSVAFIISEISFALVTANEHIDYFFGNYVTIPVAIKLCLYVALAHIPASLCISVALASFISFHRLAPETQTSSFFIKLGSGLLCFIPLAVAIYLFDLHLGPQLKVKTTEILWDIKTGGYPRHLDDSGSESPDFKNYNPVTSTKEVLYYRLDSLTTEYDKIKAECSELLALLPDSMASEAYYSYLLNSLGVVYQFDPQTTNIKTDSLMTESLMYELQEIQQEELYNTAVWLHECNIELAKYREEHYRRMHNSISLLLEFLIFASVGYFLRKKTIKMIMITLAVFVLAAVFLKQMTNLTGNYIKESRSTAYQFTNNRRAR